MDLNCNKISIDGPLVNLMVVAECSSAFSIHSLINTRTCSLHIGSLLAVEAAP